MNYFKTPSHNKKPLLRAYATIGVTFAILCVLAVIVYRGQSELATYTEAANKYANFAVRMEEFISTLKDSETGMRGFLLTKDSIFLTPYHYAKQRTDSILTIVATYQKDDVIDKNQIQQLRTLSNEILDIQKESVKYGNDSNLRLGKIRMDELRKIVNELKVTRFNRFKEYRQFQDESIKKVPFYLLIIIVAALTIFLISGFVVLRLIKNLIKSQNKLAAKIEEAQRFNRELDQYSFTLTHHLQEPLRKTRMFISRFQVKNKSLFTEGGGDISFLNKAEESAKQAQVYLDEFLNYSQITHQKEIVREKIDLNKLIDAVLKEHNEAIQKCGAEIRIDALPTIWGDMKQMHTLWWHLVDNALKYRNPAQQLKINIEYLKSTQNNVRLSISDNGNGFDMAHKEKVFEIFQRLKNDTEIVGLGLGLAICNRIIERHNGTMSVGSELGQGSNFNIYLPLSILKA